MSPEAEGGIQERDLGRRVFLLLLLSASLWGMAGMCPGISPPQILQEKASVLSISGAWEAQPL